MFARSRPGLVLAAVLLLAAGDDRADTTNTAAPPAPAVAVDTPPGGFPVKKDWRWVKGVVFVPTNCVNEAQQWDEYDPAINDRELRYASFYGFNLVRVFLHFDIYLKDKAKLLANIEDFLTRADRNGIKTEFVFFDDCHSQPDPAVLQPGYEYPAPLFGVHNSRWWQCPGNAIKQDVGGEEPQLEAYVQDIVTAHRADSRIAFWEVYNEPNKSPGTRFLLEKGLEWIHATGTPIPVTSTGGAFAGGPYSDFLSWHWYGQGKLPDHGPDALNTECMDRKTQSVPFVVDAMKGKSGYVMWELGIGRDDCRFAWSDSAKHPATWEPATPFHGIVYADGHPWSVDDVKATMGAAAFEAAPVFEVTYFKDAHFQAEAKRSITPMIDFDLADEEGYGSPDASAGIPKDHFSTIWRGTILAPASGTYTFYADSDGQVQVSIDSRVLLNKTAFGRAVASQTINLTSGKTYPVEIRYAHATGPASLHFDWSGPNLAKTVVLPVPAPLSTP